jgi:hypothetical protein
LSLNAIAQQQRRITFHDEIMMDRRAELRLRNNERKSRAQS